MPEQQPPKPLDDKESGESKYATLPSPIDLTKTVASIDTSTTEVEHGGSPDPNEGADPYLRITGWKRP